MNIMTGGKETMWVKVPGYYLLLYVQRSASFSITVIGTV